MYTVKQVAEITGISSYTLRFYDKEGLFPHLNRDEQNRRLFSEADVSSIETIQDLRKMGFSLAQIRSYLGAEERPPAVGARRRRAADEDASVKGRSLRRHGGETAASRGNTVMDRRLKAP